MSEGGIGDLNNDGWLDIHLGQTIRYNNGGSNHWVKFELQGIFSNKNGIGARLKLYGPWGMQTREIRSGNAFSHMSTLQAHFGLGTATAIDSVVISWPSCVRTVLAGPVSIQLHIVPEGNAHWGPSRIIGSATICTGQDRHAQRAHRIRELYGAMVPPPVRSRYRKAAISPWWESVRTIAPPFPTASR
ncbi:MAG: ASPIC/UnbV domain-containing protein [Flavobacteriales bacterium]|nr:ASPIC/UnbV domain-containing protein [Flavobacteriales bacterium]